MKYSHPFALPSLLACSVLLVTSCSLSAQQTVNTSDKLAYTYLKQLVSTTQGIGAREAGTEKEKQTADYIKANFEKFGYRVTKQYFSFKSRGIEAESQNIIAELGDSTKPTIILGAHYDSTGMKSGSMGATDNGAGVAAMLSIAEALSDQIPKNYNIRFIAFGAEEIGLQGSNYYVSDLFKNNKLQNIAAMINFDTIAGGDNVYVHSAHITPYSRCKSENYSSDISIREALLSASINVLGEKNKYVIHPDYEGYPKGVTGSWSDHANFACAGIPIAYVESTNFTINGANGFDGYSQSTAEKLWTCYDQKNSTACDKKAEQNWGNIWHTKFDSLEELNKIFPGRVEQQLGDNVNVLIELLSDPDKYLLSK
jgi:Zn-dependent M28 family amino/carboxypeptidase